jgi:uncharacterized protein YdaU (DUF1376 family)
MSTSNGLFIDYCAKDFLDGTQTLQPWEELAYRRICDLIYATNDALADDDRKLAWQTKTGNRWLRIKAELIAQGKILVEDGKITNRRCQKTLEKSSRRIAQRVAAANSSNASRKTLKNNNSVGADAHTDVIAVAAADAVTTQEPKNPRTQEPKKKKETPQSPPSPTTGDEVAEPDGNQEGNQGGDGVRGGGDGRYAFCGRVIRLSEDDLRTWAKTFHAVPDIVAELSSIDAWMSGQAEAKRKSWYHLTAGCLNRKHQEFLKRNPIPVVQPRRPTTKDYHPELDFIR